MAKWIVIAEIIFVLVPLTLGLFILIFIGLDTLSAIIFGNEKLPNIDVVIVYLIIVTAEFLASYGLFALWWLFFNHAKISIKQIPKCILYGLIVGAAINLLMISALLIPGLISPIGRIPLIFYSPSSFIFCTGPLLILFTLTSLMWLQNSPRRVQ